MKKSYKILLGIAVIGLGIQLIPVERSNPPVDKSKDFVTVTQNNEKVKSMLKNSCYDCHSNEVVYPWYANVAPISWSIQNHVNEGRKHLNFSEWEGYNTDIKKKTLLESSEVLLNREMPLKGYLPLHPEARLTEEERVFLSEYFLTLSKTVK